MDFIDWTIEQCSTDESLHDTYENAATLASSQISFPIDNDFLTESANVELDKVYLLPVSSGLRKILAAGGENDRYMS